MREITAGTMRVCDALLVNNWEASEKVLEVRMRGIACLDDGDGGAHYAAVPLKYKIKSRSCARANLGMAALHEISAG